MCRSVLWWLLKAQAHTWQPSTEVHNTVIADHFQARCIWKRTCRYITAGEMGKRTTISMQKTCSLHFICTFLAIETLAQPDTFSCTADRYARMCEHTFCSLTHTSLQWVWRNPDMALRANLASMPLQVRYVNWKDFRFFVFSFFYKFSFEVTTHFRVLIWYSYANKHLLVFKNPIVQSGTIVVSPLGPFCR